MSSSTTSIDPKVLAKFSSLYLVAKTVVEGFITGLHKSYYKGFSVEFAEHREYTAGDDLRYLDWKVFARTDRMYIKVFREETNVKSYILLDASASMRYTSHSVSKLEYGAMLASALSYLMISQKDAVGLATFDTALRTLVKPASTSAQLHFLADRLEHTQPGGRTSLGPVLASVAPHIKRRSLIILISDLLDDPEAVMKGLARFKHHRHELIVFHLFDPAEVSFPFTGQHEFVDPETGEKIAADALTVKAGYKKAVDEFCGSFRKHCVSNDISYAHTTTDTPFDYFLYQYLTMRAKYT